MPPGGLIDSSRKFDLAHFWENVEKRNDEGGHEDSRDGELCLQFTLHVLAGHLANSDEKNGDEGSDDANCGDHEREVGGVGSRDDVEGGGGDDESGARRLGEGAEKICAHTCDVAHVVTDVVSDGAGVVRGVLLEALADLASEISTDVSGLGVDAATDSAEESDGGATEAVAGDDFEELADGIGDVFLVAAEGGGQHSLAVPDDEELQDEDGETDQAEAEDFAALEGDVEALMDARVASPGRPHVAVRRDAHADVAAEHRRDSTDVEGKGGIGEVAGGASTLLEVDGEVNQDGEEEAEYRQVRVFLLEELVCASPDELRDAEHHVESLLLSLRRHALVLHRHDLLLLLLGDLGHLDCILSHLNLLEHPVAIVGIDEGQDGRAEDKIVGILRLQVAARARLHTTLAGLSKKFLRRCSSGALDLRTACELRKHLLGCFL
mmetsp:Transcript_26851/g.31559  ORF Transcript_26851/g.31559 Transcript_26851/m.31559 type:complete len:437 (-) Transcript_26851:51-1361(-)